MTVKKSTQKQQVKIKEPPGWKHRIKELHMKLPSDKKQLMVFLFAKQFGVKPRQFYKIRNQQAELRGDMVAWFVKSFGLATVDELYSEPLKIRHIDEEAQLQKQKQEEEEQAFLAKYKLRKPKK